MLWADSDALLKANLAKSHSPYYLMSQLGGNARKRGQNEQALKWYGEAFARSEGPATRLQWGAGYFSALVELAPQDAPRIQARYLSTPEDRQVAADALKLTRSIVAAPGEATTINATGNDLANALTGNDLDNRLDGNGGDNQLAGLDGAKESTTAYAATGSPSPAP